MIDEQQTDDRTRWGRVRFGGRRLPALAVAVPVGLALAFGVGALATLTEVGAEHPLLFGGLVSAFTAVGLIALVWALVVDRMTLRGAQERPEESVESTWLNTAMQGAFTDTIAITGLGLTALAITRYELDVIWALSAVLVVAFASCGVRFLVAKTRG